MKTKTWALSLAALLISVASFSQQAKHTGKGKQDNLLFLLRQPEHINQALKTVGQLRAGLKTSLNPGNIEIIVCGEAVTQLTTTAGADWAEKIKQYPGVSIVACGLSMAKFDKTEKDLVPGIKYTENGFVRAFELQKAGYLSVEL